MRRHAICLATMLGACSTSPGPQHVVGKLRWAVDLGGPTDESAVATAFDSSGNVLVLGGYADAPYSPPDAPPLLTNAFLLKLSGVDGSQLWRVDLVKQTSDSGVSPGGLAVNGLDQVYVTGAYWGTSDVGGQVLGTDATSHGSFLAAYESDGRLRSVRAFPVGPQVFVSANAIAVQPSGQIVIAGMFGNGSMAMGPQVFSQPQTDADGFLVSVDELGSVSWGQQFVTTSLGPLTPGGLYLSSMTTAANGDVVMVGTFQSPTSFGGVDVDPDTFQRAFMVRCDSSGAVVDARAVGAGGLDHSSGIDVVITTDDEVVVHTVDALSGWYPHNQVYALTSAGDGWTAPQWDDNNSRLFPIPRRLTAMPNGLVLSSAWVDYLYRDQPQIVSGHLDIVAYDAAGRPTSQQVASRVSYGDQARNGGDTQVTGTAATEGSVVFLGNFNGTLDFGSGPVTAHGEYDIDDFVAVFDAP